jgi:hypothetical protein
MTSRFPFKDDSDREKHSRTPTSGNRWEFELGGVRSVKRQETLSRPDSRLCQTAYHAACSGLISIFPFKERCYRKWRPAVDVCGRNGWWLVIPASDLFHTANTGNLQATSRNVGYRLGIPQKRFIGLTWVLIEDKRRHGDEEF